MSETPFLDTCVNESPDTGIPVGCLVLVNWITPEGEKAWGWEGEGDMDIAQMYGIMGRMNAELQKQITMRALREELYGDQ
jgi:hypothetical protein